MIHFLLNLFTKHDVGLFPVSRMHFAHSIAFVTLVFWGAQLVSGFLLLGLIAWSLERNFVELVSIVFHGNYVWLLRMLHMLGANFVIITTIVHFSKAMLVSKLVTPNKNLIWLVGSALFLISLGTAFTGYVVVSGNMSFWAALVILNLLSVVPALGDEIVAGILGSSTVTSWGIRRFTVLHFLLGVVAIALIAIHLVILHRISPGKGGNVATTDGTSTLATVLVKDLALFLMIFALLFWDGIKTLVHPDNWAGFSRLITPAHIEPEIYFLWTFSAIKLHNGKLCGVAFILNREQYLRLAFWCQPCLPCSFSILWQQSECSSRFQSVTD